MARQRQPFKHRNLFDNINLFMDIHNLTSISIWCPKSYKRKRKMTSWLVNAINQLIGCKVYLITNKPESWKGIEGVEITNNAPGQTLVLTFGVHFIRELDTCNLKQQLYLIDIQKNSKVKKGFGVISYLFQGIGYDEWLKEQVSEYINEEHHITKEELFKDCQYLAIPKGNA